MPPCPQASPACSWAVSSCSAVDYLRVLPWERLYSQALVEEKLLQKFLAPGALAGAQGWNSSGLLWLEELGAEFAVSLCLCCLPPCQACPKPEYMVWHWHS